MISVQREGGFALDKAAGYVVDTVMRVAVDGIDQVSCRTPSDGTRCLVSSLMRGLLCSALDAVAKETPAKAATSSSCAARPVNVWAIMLDSSCDQRCPEAGVVVLLIPCAILFLALRKYYVKGFMAGSPVGSQQAPG